LIEGITSRAVPSMRIRIYIYIRGEYRYVLDIVEAAMAKLRARLLGKIFWLWI